MGLVRGLPHFCCDVDGAITQVPLEMEKGWVDPVSISELWLPEGG